AADLDGEGHGRPIAVRTADRPVQRELRPGADRVGVELVDRRAPLYRRFSDRVLQDGGVGEQCRDGRGVTGVEGVDVGAQYLLHVLLARHATSLASAWFIS